MTPPPTPPPPRRVCFSFAAYAKTLIHHLRASQIPIADGLSDAEFAAIESAYGFDFPPELRSILREGLPVGPGFPNWRSSFDQQLRILLSLPITGLLNDVNKGAFWSSAWGPRPPSSSVAVSVAKRELDAAPVLVPIYRHFYLPSHPNLAGNPVLFIRGSELRCSGFDLVGFFEHEEFRAGRCHAASRTQIVTPMPAPAWAAKSARRIEVWTDLMEGVGEWRERWTAAGVELARCMKEVGWRLREGGWREEEVREMLMMGTDGRDGLRYGERMVLRDKESVAWHVRVLGLALLRAGWSSEDVVYCMGGGGNEE